MWAMWANIFKNFVRGPSAAVALWPGPSPGGLAPKANGHAGRVASGQRAHVGAQPCGQHGRAAMRPAGRWPYGH